MNDRRLSEAEIDTIVSWVDGGAKHGNLADAPAPRVFADAWTIGTPDAVYAMEEDYEIGPEGADEHIYGSPVVSGDLICVGGHGLWTLPRLWKTPETPGERGV